MNTWKSDTAAALALLLFLPVLLPDATLLAATGAAAVEPVPNVFLPMVVAPGQRSPPPDTPYAAALSQALANCAATALNQVGYAGGSVTLDGGGSLATPGQLASLDGVSGFRFTPAHWKYTGNQILAETIFTGREAMFWDGVSTGATWLVMLHKPGGYRRIIVPVPLGLMLSVR